MRDPRKSEAHCARLSSTWGIADISGRDQTSWARLLSMATHTLTVDLLSEASNDATGALGFHWGKPSVQGLRGRQRKMALNVTEESRNLSSYLSRHIPCAGENPSHEVHKA